MKQLTIKQMQAIDNMYESINFCNEYLIYLHTKNMRIGRPHKNDEVSILFRAMEKIKNGIETYENRKNAMEAEKWLK